MRRGLALVAIALLLGCAGGGSRDAVVRTYDLGGSPPAARLSSVRALPVRAPAPFDTSDMLYRLAFRNPAELHLFSESRWAATPAVLLHRQFSRASGDRQARCEFEFEVDEFTQVFASAVSSEFVFEGRVWVISPGAGRVAQRQFRVTESGAGGNAASGVAAVTRAVDRMIIEIDSWTSGMPACKSG